MGRRQLIDSTFTTKAVRPRFEDSQQYGYGWWLGDVDGKSFFSMRGHLGQYVIVFPEDDVVIVRLGHRGMPTYLTLIPLQIYPFCT